MTTKKSENIWKLLKNYSLEYEIEPTDDLKCVICHQVLINAHQTPCACRFCFECISNYLDGEEKFCPGQMEDCKEHKLNLKKDIQIDYIINRKISVLKVNCPNVFCNLAIELKKLEEHMSAHLIRCPYSEMGCCCQPENVIDKMNEHLDSECYFHTNILIEYIENLKSELTSVKENLKSVQGNLKENNTFNSEVLKIIEQIQEVNSVKNEEINKLKVDLDLCVSENLRLNENLKITREEVEILKEDLQTKQGIILKLQEKKDENSVNENEEILALKKELSLYKSEHMKLFEEMKARKNEIKTINENLLIKQKLIIKLERRIEHLKMISEFSDDNVHIEKGDVENNKEIIQNMMGQLLQDVNQSHKPFEMKKIFKNVLESNTEEEAIGFLRQSSLFIAQTLKENIAPYDWKIEHFSHKWKLAREGIDPYIMSGDFYSHRNGYKMILGIYPDGFDTEQGIFLSVFFHIAKGDDDDKLPWPMRNELSISLINQETGIPYNIEKFQYDTADKGFLPSYHKPKTAINLGYGDTRFIDLLTLFNNKALLKNDSIILRCSVEKLQN